MATQTTPELEAPDDPANEQPLVSHLVELRNRMVRASLAVLEIGRAHV